MSVATHSSETIIGDGQSNIEVSPDVDVPFEHTKLTLRDQLWLLTVGETTKRLDFPQIDEVSPGVLQFSFKRGLYITKSKTCAETGHVDLLVAWTSRPAWLSFVSALSNAVRVQKARILSSRARCPVCGRVFWHKRGTRSLGSCRRCKRALTCSPIWLGQAHSSEVAA